MFPGDYFALTYNPTAVKSQYYTSKPDGFINVPFNSSTFTITEDVVVLIDISNQRIDQFRYKSSLHFALLNFTKGISLERLNPDKPTQDNTNWHSAAESAGFATPGYRNSQYSEASNDGSEISIDPEIFSPDNDGHNDVANINYHLDAPGYTANVTIFDSRGRHIRKLTSNELLGTSGFFTWDGVNDKHEKASIGIYIFFVEIFKLDGTVKSFKKTCVLASRL
ncbi:MAG: gliding motility-associated C-terminal domain-containing protein [Bacteroidia bacterium]|nr:gliding motility-associated C-terminal domain-containing protein [Bacteroidia bacterium]